MKEIGSNIMYFDQLSKEVLTRTYFVRGEKTVQLTFVSNALKTGELTMTEPWVSEYRMLLATAE